jgi:aspartate oxidase
MKFDVAIVGSGLAGLSVALNLASTRRVALIAKRSMMEGASDYAQGGIAAVLDSADSIENHVDDTLVAGGGLCDEGATRYIVEHGREAIEWLIDRGVPFTRTTRPNSASTSRAKAAIATAASSTRPTPPAMRCSRRCPSAHASIRTSRSSRTTTRST